MGERDFKLPDGRIIKLDFKKTSKKKFLASCSPLSGKISVENTMFLEFKKPEQDSIIYHEIWHKENNLKFEKDILFSRRFYLVLLDVLRAILFLGSSISKLQEFEADKYACLLNYKSNTLNMLIKIKKLVESGKIQYDLKNHPKIDERIKKIKELPDNKFEH